MTPFLRDLAREITANLPQRPKPPEIQWDKVLPSWFRAFEDQPHRGDMRVPTKILPLVADNSPFRGNALRFGKTVEQVLEYLKRQGGNGEEGTIGVWRSRLKGNDIFFRDDSGKLIMAGLTTFGSVVSITHKGTSAEANMCLKASLLGVGSPFYRATFWGDDLQSLREFFELFPKASIRQIGDSVLSMLQHDPPNKATNTTLGKHGSDLIGVIDNDTQRITVKIDRTNGREALWVGVSASQDPLLKGLAQRIYDRAKRNARESPSLSWTPS